MRFPDVRWIHSPRNEEDWRPLSPEVESVQFEGPFADDDYKRIAKMVLARPNVGLRVFSQWTKDIQDLDFLQHFVGLRRFQFDRLNGLRDVSGLRYLSADLESLVFGPTGNHRHSLSIIAAFPKLRTLYLDSQSRDIDAIGELRELRRLTLRSVTLPDLSVLLPLCSLEELELKLGGTRNLSHLPQIGHLRYFEAWLVRQLDDLSVLADVSTLQRLSLQALRNVTHLPSFAPLTELRWLGLDTMKGLRDLSPVAAAPRLEKLALVAMQHLEVSDLHCLVGHPTLREMIAGLGSDRKNSAAKALLPAARQWSAAFEYA